MGKTRYCEMHKEDIEEALEKYKCMACGKRIEEGGLYCAMRVQLA